MVRPSEGLNMAISQIPFCRAGILTKRGAICGDGTGFAVILIHYSFDGIGLNCSTAFYGVVRTELIAAVKSGFV